TFIVFDDGTFVIGKAATTPHDEAVGFMESVEDALSYTADTDRSRLFADLEVSLYAGTTMLNTLLSRTGQRLGLIITKGFEDTLLHGRGMQSWAEYSYPDRLHAATHVHPSPLIPKARIRGVTERVDHFGHVAIPMYEHDVERAAEELLESDVEGFCICFLMSYLNPAHELRAKQIVEDVIGRRGAELPVFLSSTVRPVMREGSRLNSTVVEAYAAAPVRRHLHKIEDVIQAEGFRNPLQTILSYGGLANIRYPRLHETMISGPVGGMLGAQYVGDVIGARNIVVSDLGGTSFDIGAITEGRTPINGEPTLARFKFNLPTIDLESIGAGAGTIVKVDPHTGKVELGPESAGSSPGPVCFGMGGTRATICDCDLLLGYLNPENFLGGKVRLHPQLALEAIQEQITGPLGVDVYDGAEGVVRLLETEAREALRRTVSARGFDVPEYYLMSYGGAGPLHVAGYSRGLGFKEVLTFPYAAAFSAFGCTTADYMHRYERSLHLDVPADADDALKETVAGEMDKIWRELADTAGEHMEQEGRDVSQLQLVPFAMIRYTGQLTDVEVISTSLRVGGANGLDSLLADWEREYERINRRVSRYAQAGFTVFELGMLATIPKVKPQISRQSLASPTPSASAQRGEREIYWEGSWSTARIWDMEALVPGNEIEGPAVIEHPATTFLIPPDHHTLLDEWNIFHLEERETSR
ncbi:MAG: acetone carboxylase, beta subunit, partial [Solirubrobacteraceae bacterium]|nr:acetone carboxylase, beta subunit [Solirubrobacteraceae bacterium]